MLAASWAPIPDSALRLKFVMRSDFIHGILCVQNVFMFSLDRFFLNYCAKEVVYSKKNTQGTASITPKTLDIRG